jgi:hypothetical protein
LGIPTQLKIGRMQRCTQTTDKRARASVVPAGADEGEGSPMPRISLEAATRALLGKGHDEHDGERREHGARSKITLPRVAFLERPLPSWWHDPIPPPAPMKLKRKGRRHDDRYQTTEKSKTPPCG